MDKKLKLHSPKTWLIYLLLVLLALVWIAPAFTLIATALKSKKDFYSGMSLFQLPPQIAWDNFSAAITSGHMFFYMKNDLVICLIKVPLGILLEAMAAFAITRLRVRNRTSVFIFFLIGMMLPMQVALIPISIVFGKLGLFNTYIGLGVVYIGFGISFGILVLRGFMSGIPHELDEVATRCSSSRASYCRCPSQLSPHCSLATFSPRGTSICSRLSLSPRMR